MLFPHPPRLQAPGTFPCRLTRQLPTSTPSQLEHWLAQLHQHPPLQQAELLCLTIAQYNNERLLPITRMLLLELLRPTVFEIGQHIEGQYPSNCADNGLATRTAARLMQLLHMHLRRGYHRVLTQDVKLASEQQNKALQRSMRSAKEVQIYAALQYRCPPAGLWLKLHQHFQLALQLGLHNKEIADSTLHPVDQQTVEQAYVDNLLLALIQPQRLARARIRAVADELSPLCRHSGIQRAIASSRLALATDLDQPFRDQRSAELSPTQELDSRSLLNAVDKFGSLIEDDVLQGLRLAMDGRMSQRIEPTPASTDVEAVLDLQQLTKHLASPDSDGNITLRYKARLLGSNKEGICLHWHHPGNHRLQVGMLLALRSHPDAPWHLEQVIWAMHNDKEQLILGLRNWAIALQPCLVKPHLQSASDLRFHTALLLTDGDGRQSLLLPPTYTHNAVKAWLHHDGIERPIRLELCLETSDQGRRFAFS